MKNRIPLVVLALACASPAFADTDALDVFAGSQFYGFSGELLYLDFEPAQPSRNGAGFVAYQVNKTMVAPRISRAAVPRLTSGFEVTVTVRDVDNNDLYTLTWENCVVTEILHLPGQTHPTFDCPADP